jgi:hypothetical protein
LTATTILDDLARQGVALWPDGDELVYDAPPASVTPELLATLRERRCEILAALKASTADSPLDERRNINRDAGRCGQHINPADWQDSRANRGMIRTACKRCGGFIGYRPAEKRRTARPRRPPPT